MNELMKQIKKELKRESINYEVIENTKNGVNRIGIKIHSKNNAEPTIYIRKGDLAKDIIEKIKHVLTITNNIQMDYLTNADYVLSHLRMGLQRKSDAYIIKKDILNLEAYLKIDVDENSELKGGEIKITSQFLSSIGISEKQAWDVAYENMRGDYWIMSMADALGMPSDLLPIKFFVCSTERNVDGATALMFPQIFHDFCREQGVESCVILPSSIHELLLLPINKNELITDKELAQMVQEVNDTTVDPIIQLEPCIYRYNLRNECLSIAARYMDNI